VTKQKLNKTRLCQDICTDQAKVEQRLVNMKNLLSNLRLALEHV